MNTIVSSTRLATAAIAALSLTAVSVGVINSTSAFGAEPTSETSSTSTQVRYEDVLTEFLRTSPEPRPVAADASVDDQNAYWASMHSWWEDVPWDAVAGQWGCQSGEQSVTPNEADASGVVTYGHGGVMHCGDEMDDDALALVALTETRTTSETRLAAARAADATAITKCDFAGGNEDFCLSRPSSGSSTLTASFRWNLGSTQTGRARLGHVGSSGCAQGNQLALGALGTGSAGTVWYATGSASFNASFSSSFLFASGNLYGRWCIDM